MSRPCCRFFVGSTRLDCSQPLSGLRFLVGLMVFVCWQLRGWREVSQRCQALWSNVELFFQGLSMQPTQISVRDEHGVTCMYPSSHILHTTETMQRFPAVLANVLTLGSPCDLSFTFWDISDPLLTSSKATYCTWPDFLKFRPILGVCHPTFRQDCQGEIVGSLVSMDLYCSWSKRISTGGILESSYIDSRLMINLCIMHQFLGISKSRPPHRVPKDKAPGVIIHHRSGTLDTSGHLYVWDGSLAHHLGCLCAECLTYLCEPQPKVRWRMASCA